jgi:hypothetical protein
MDWYSKKMYYLYAFLAILLFIGVITLILYLLQLPPFSKSTDECRHNNECPDGICSSNKCVQCEQDIDCSEGVCKNNKCIQCNQNTDCLSGVCSNNNKCVGCNDNSDCPDGFCKDNKCVQCSQNKDCKIGSCKDNKCVGCKGNSECNGDNMCINGICEQCVKDTDCKIGICNDKNKCAGCKSNDECKNGQVCKDNTCVNCSSNSDCINGSEICLNGKCKTGNCIKTADCTDGMICSDNKCSDCKTDSQCETTGDICVGNGTKRCGNFVRDRIYTNNQFDYVKLPNANPYDCVTACEKNKNCESWTLDSGGCRLIGENTCSNKSSEGNYISSRNAIDNKCDGDLCSLKFESYDQKCKVPSDCEYVPEDKGKFGCKNGKCYGYANQPPYVWYQSSCGLTKSPVLPTDKVEEIGKNIKKSLEGKTTGDPCSFKDYSPNPMTINGISNYCKSRPGGGDMLCSIDPSVDPTPNYCIPDKLCSRYEGTTAVNTQGKCIKQYS